MSKDKSTLVPIGINYEHHEIHNGSHFFYQNFAELDDGISIDFGILPPANNKETHFVFEIQAQATFTFQYYEASTITWDGTPITALNNDRNSSAVSNWAQFELNPTIVAVGNLLGAALLGNATSPINRIPGGGERDREMILKQNTAYLFRITSGADGNNVSWLAEWYEHTRKQ